jgi:hypothetical protein
MRKALGIAGGRSRYRAPIFALVDGRVPTAGAYLATCYLDTAMALCDVKEQP